MEEKRAEMDALFRSGIFARAPNLEKFLHYICRHHFDGTAERLKEYSIAVEALGRPPEFDQKHDSIVRVEAHRLRKRLGEYYAGPGANHFIHIVIPRGSYAPQFVMSEPKGSESPSVSIAEADPQPIQSETAPPTASLAQEATSPQVHPAALGMLSRKRLILGLMLGLIFLLAGFQQFRETSRPAAPSVDSQVGNERWHAAPGQAVPAEFRVLAGYHGSPLRDVQGREWQADSYYSGGHSIALPLDTAIQGSPSTRLLKTFRSGSFHYDIPVSEGAFEVHIYFAETEYGVGTANGGGDGSRLFRLSINGRSQVDLLDVHTQAGGPNRLLVRVFKNVSRTNDGKIHISFEPVVHMAILNAIEILPTKSGLIQPVRIVAQDHSVTDSNGQIWRADEYVIGGTLVLRPNTIFDNHKLRIYQGERFGNFTYHIPLAPGKYRLILHFAETWFGTRSAGGSEYRLFDVYANGLALLRNFNLLSEAGAPNKGIEKVFEGMEPNAQGQLTLQFVPLANYAEVNAIEVVETE